MKKTLSTSRFLALALFALTLAGFAHAEEVPWWNTGYACRNRITVGNNSSTATVPAGYSTYFHGNHYGLVQSGTSLANGNDVRVVYWNGTQNVEIDRVNETVWNTSGTNAQIWFKLQAEIAASGSDGNYFLYYGNPAAGAPPANASNVYLWFDNFSSNTLTNYVNGKHVDIHGDNTHVLSYDSANGRVTFDTGDNYCGGLRIPSITDGNILVQCDVMVDRTYPTSGTLCLGLRWSSSSSGYYTHFSNGSYTSPGMADAAGAERNTNVAGPSGGNTYFPANGTTHNVKYAIFGGQHRFWYDQDYPTAANALLSDNGTHNSYTSGNPFIQAAQQRGWFDNYLVRKYMETEPSSALGAQQNLASYKVTGTHPYTTAVAQGEQNVQILRLDIATGADDTLTNLRVTSLNTSDADVSGVSCYYTGTSYTFETTAPFGTANQTFAGGLVTFTGTRALPANTTVHLYVVYNIAPGATSGDTLDCGINTDDITISGTNYPATGYVHPDGSRSIQPPQTLGAITVINSDTSNVGQGDLNRQILRIAVPVSGSGSPLTLSSLRVTAANSTDSDVAGVSCYYTGTSPTFSADTPFGTASTPLAGGKATFTGNLDFAAANSTHYLFVAYDISELAGDGDTVDAKILANDITINGVTRSPVDGDPTGSRTIVIPTGNVTGLAPTAFKVDANPSFMAGQLDDFGTVARLASNDSSYSGAQFEPGTVFNPQELWTEFTYDLSSYGIDGADINSASFSAELYLTGQNTGTTPRNDPPEWEAIDDAKVQIYNNATGEWDDMGAAFLSATASGWDTSAEAASWDNTNDTNAERPLTRAKSGGFVDGYLDGDGKLKVRVWIKGRMNGVNEDCNMVFDYALLNFNYGSSTEQTSSRWADSSEAALADENETVTAAPGQQLHLRAGIRSNNSALSTHYLALQYSTSPTFSSPTLMSTSTTGLKMWNDASHAEGDAMSSANLLSGTPLDGIYHEDNVPPGQTKLANSVYEEDFTVEAVAEGTYYVRVVRVDASGGNPTLLDNYAQVAQITVAPASNDQAAYDWAPDAANPAWQGDDTGLSFTPGSKYLLAVRIDHSGARSDFDWQLQYQQDPNSNPGAWVTVNTSSALWKCVSSAAKSNQNTIDLPGEAATAAGTGTVTDGRFSNDDDGAQLNVWRNPTYTEFWYCIQPDSSTVGHSYRFRVTDLGDASAFSYSVYPLAANVTHEQVSFRWADDGENAIATENTTATVPVDDDLHLRVGIRSNAGGWTRNLALQMDVDGDGNWSTGTQALLTQSSANLRMWDDADRADGDALSGTKLLSGSPTGGIYHEDEDQPSATEQSGDILYEEDFTVRATAAGTYYLRVVEVDANGANPAVLDAYISAITLTAAIPANSQAATCWGDDAAAPTFQSAGSAKSFEPGGKYILALRMENSSAISSACNWRLQYQRTDGGDWTNVTTSSADWRAANGAYAVGDEIIATGDFVCGAGTGAAVAGQYSETGTISHTLAANSYTEYWYVIEPNTSASGYSYRFRLTDNGDAGSFTYQQYALAADVTHQQTAYRWADSGEAAMSDQNTAAQVGVDQDLHLRVGLRSGNGDWSGHNLALQYDTSPTFPAPVLVTQSSANVRMWDDASHADGDALSGTKLLSGSPVGGIYHEDQDQPSAQSKTADTPYEEDFTVRVTTAGTYYLRVVEVDASGANPSALDAYATNIEVSASTSSISQTSFDWAGDAATPDFSGADDDSLFFNPASTYILALRVENSGGATPTRNWQVQYQKDPYGTPASWVTVTTTSADWKMVAASAKNDQDIVAIPSEAATAAGAGTARSGVYAENNDIGATASLAGSSYTEYWFAVQPQAAASGNEYRFRITNSGSTMGISYSVYAESANLRRWLGTSSAWNASSNWKPAGVPASGEKALIAPATNGALLGSAVQIGYLQLASGGALDTAGYDLTAASGIANSGTLTLSSGSSVMLGANSDFNSTGNLNIQSGVAVTRESSGYFSLDWGGNVSVLGTPASPVTVDYADLNLSGTGSSVAEYIRMGNIADGGTYLTVSGTGWNDYSFRGWGFKEISGGADEVSVRIETGGRIAMTYFESAAGDLYGEDTDEESGINGASGFVSWAATPAMIDSFTATPTDKGVVLDWTTLTEMHNAGFHLYRKLLQPENETPVRFAATRPEEGWKKITPELIDGANGSFVTQRYRILDPDATAGEYAYALVDIDLGGNAFCRKAPVRVRTVGADKNPKPVLASLKNPRFAGTIMNALGGFGSESLWAGISRLLISPVTGLTSMMSDMLMPQISRGNAPNAIGGQAAQNQARQQADTGDLPVVGIKLPAILNKAFGAISSAGTWFGRGWVGGKDDWGQAFLNYAWKSFTLQPPALPIPDKVAEAEATPEALTPASPQQSEKDHLSDKKNGNSDDTGEPESATPSYTGPRDMAALKELLKKVAASGEDNSGAEYADDSDAPVILPVSGDGENGSQPSRDNGEATPVSDDNHYRSDNPREYNPPEPSYDFAEACARIETNAAGLCRIESTDLDALGFDPEKDVRLYRRGERVPMWKVPANTDSGWALIFYAPQHRTQYSATNVFWLRQIEKSPESVTEFKTVATGAGASEYEAVSRLDADQYLQMQLIGSTAEEDHWFLAQKLFKGRSVNFALDCNYPKNSPARLSLLLRSNVEGIPSAHVKVSISGVQVGEFSWIGARRFLAEMDVPPGLLKHGSNIITLTSVGDTPGIREYTYTDYVELKYRRQAVALNGELTLNALATGTTVDGFSSGGIIAADITGAPELIEKIGVSQTGGAFRASFASTVGHNYVIGEISSLPSPRRMDATSPRKTAHVDYLIVTDDDLKPAAESFATFHRSHGYSVGIFTLTEALDYGFDGIYDPQAVEKLIKDTAPSYLLLLGETTYDYKATYFDDVSYSIPARMVVNHDFLGCSDYYYSTAVDGKPSVAVGRIPARSTTEAEIVLAKIIARSGSGLTGLVSIGDPSEGKFETTASEAMAFAKGSFTLIAADATNPAPARTALLSAWNAGAATVFYSGHGSAYQWSDSNLFSQNSIASLSEQDAPPVVIQLDCLGSSSHMWAADGRGCLAEHLLLAERKGASAVIGSSSFSSPKGQKKFGLGILANLKSGLDIGQAFRTAQQSFSEDGGDPDVLESFILLGDPAAK